MLPQFLLKYFELSNNITNASDKITHNKILFFLKFFDAWIDGKYSCKCCMEICIFFNLKQ